MLTPKLGFHPPSVHSLVPSSWLFLIPLTAAARGGHAEKQMKIMPFMPLWPVHSVEMLVLCKLSVLVMDSTWKSLISLNSPGLWRKALHEELRGFYGLFFFALNRNDLQKGTGIKGEKGIWGQVFEALLRASFQFVVYQSGILEGQEVRVWGFLFLLQRRNITTEMPSLASRKDYNG